MGQKVNPKSLRLGIIHSWESTWIADAKIYAKNVKEDDQIRKFLRKKLKAAAISRIEIDRKAQRLIIRIITGRPGMVVGRGGQGLDGLRKQLQALTGRRDMQIDVMEVNRIEADATLVAESIAQQLEKRVAYRRAMKQAMQRSMRSGVKGIKIMISGRLGGAEIARTEWSKEGRIPLHTFRADIDYGFVEALTVFGIIGVKVWVFKGEVMPGDVAASNVKPKATRPEEGAVSSSAPHGLQGAGRRSARGSSGREGGTRGGSSGREGGGGHQGRGGRQGGRQQGGARRDESRQPPSSNIADIKPPSEE